MKSSFISIAFIIITILSHSLMSGGQNISNNVNSVSSENTITNTAQNVINNEVSTDKSSSDEKEKVDVKEKYGFQSTTYYDREEGYVSSEEPSEARINFIKSVEKTLLDNNYSLEYIQVFARLNGIEIYIKLSDGPNIKFDFELVPTITARFTDEEELKNFVRILLSTPELEFSKEEIDKFITEGDISNNRWDGSISEPNNTLYRAYDFYLKGANF